MFEICTTVGNLVDQWLSQDGNCHECGTKLYPTASTKAFSFTVDEDPEEELETGESEVQGVFVCPDCKE